MDITLGTIVNDNQNASRNRNADYEKIAYTGAYLDGSRERLPFHENELLSFGTPARHHVCLFPRIYVAHHAQNLFCR